MFSMSEEAIKIPGGGGGQLKCRLERYAERGGRDLPKHDAAVRSDWQPSIKNRPRSVLAAAYIPFF